jgi:hypothetical protein
VIFVRECRDCPLFSLLLFGFFLNGPSVISSELSRPAGATNYYSVEESV